MATNYQETLKQAIRAKQTAELRIQAANINHSAACNEQNVELELKYRAEIRALTEIILDNSAIMFLCVHKMADS